MVSICSGCTWLKTAVECIRSVCQDNDGQREEKVVVLRSLILYIVNFISEQQRYLRIECVYYCSPGKDNTVGCPEVVLAHLYSTGRVVVFLKRSKTHIPQYLVLTSETSFHDVEGVVHDDEEFVSCKFIFAVWGIRCQFHFQRDESLCEMSRNKVSQRYHRA